MPSKEFIIHELITKNFFEDAVFEHASCFEIIRNCVDSIGECFCTITLCKRIFQLEIGNLLLKNVDTTYDFLFDVIGLKSIQSYSKTSISKSG